jgi:hypothetical protein
MLKIKHLLNLIKGLVLIQLPKDDQELLYDLIDSKKLPAKLITKLVNMAIEVRYQDKVIGFKDELSDLIKEYANDRKESE